MHALKRSVHPATAWAERLVATRRTSTSRRCAQLLHRMASAEDALHARQKHQTRVDRASAWAERLVATLTSTWRSRAQLLHRLAPFSKHSAEHALKRRVGSANVMAGQTVTLEERMLQKTASTEDKQPLSIGINAKTAPSSSAAVKDARVAALAAESCRPQATAGSAVIAQRNA